MSNAERQRRFRAHRRGDHTLCLPERGCPDTPPPVPEPSVSRPDELGVRGARLWREEGGETLSGARRELLFEACRIADRLDRLHLVLSGESAEWIQFVESRGGTEVTVVVGRDLAEARQQAAVLKQLLAELRQGSSAKPEKGASIVDQLAARREARRANASG